MLGVTPEAFDAIDMISTHRNAPTLANHHMVASQGQRGVGMPVVREVQTTWLGIDPYQPHHFLTIASRDREDLHLAIPFQDTEHDNLATGSPAALAFPTTAKHGFIQFQVPIKGFRALLIQGHDHPAATVESIQNRTAGKLMKTEPVHRNAQAEIIQDLMLDGLFDSETPPDGSNCVPVTTPATLATPIR